MMFKTSSQETLDNVPDGITSFGLSAEGSEPAAIYKYILFGVFLFVALLAALLLLTILIGLVTTILGCCRVSYHGYHSGVLQGGFILGLPWLPFWA